MSKVISSQDAITDWNKLASGYICDRPQVMDCYSEVYCAIYYDASSK